MASSSQKRSGKAKSPAQLSQQRGRNKQACKSDEAAAGSGLLAERALQDIAAIVLIVLSIALFIGTTSSSSGVVTSAVTTALKLTFGNGAYILPVFLLAIGLILLLRVKKTKLPMRLSIGLSFIFIAILGIMSLCSFGANANSTQFLFTESVLLSSGGYVGCGIAYAGITLFGQTISLVIMVGLICVGLAIIGLSISSVISALRDRLSEARQLNSADNNENADESSYEQKSFLSRLFSKPKRKKGGAEDNYLDSFANMNMSHTKKIMPADDVVSKNNGDFSNYACAGDTCVLSDEADAPTQIISKRGGPQSTNRKGAVSDDVNATDDMKTVKFNDGANNADSAPTKKFSDATPNNSRSSKKSSSRKSGATNSKLLMKKSQATPSPDENFELPDPNLLIKSSRENVSCASKKELQQTAQTLQQTLNDFGIDAIVKDWVAGPTVTLFKVSLPHGVRVNRVISLNNDIALALASPGVRIFAPIPGTNFVGIEVPNQTRQSVLLADVLQYAKTGPLQVAIGRDVEGNSIVSDLAKMPHLLIGGTTGSGKSVSINAMIMSILMRSTPSEVRLIMIDPKRVEFSPYNGIPHLYVPVVTEPKEAASALSWGVAEMERRLKVFSDVGARNISQYNAKAQEMAAQMAQMSQVAEMTEAAADAQGTLDNSSNSAYLDETEGEPSVSTQGDQNETPALEELPYIVIIIDELADLMMNVGKEVEFSISRIAQLARAAGIHLIVATQRPSAKVVTGLIKANITNRIAFNVASGIDSRVILDTPGAENLIGLGDLLLSKPELSKPVRVQGCYVSEEEINAVVEHLKQQGSPEYHNEILKTNLITLSDSSPDGSGGSVTDDDPLIWQAAEIVVSSDLGSTSSLQRRLKVGYARAGRIMDALEEKGVVGPPNGSKPRDVLVDTMELETLKAFEQNDE